MSTVKLGFIGIGSNASRHMQESQFTWEQKSGRFLQHRWWKSTEGNWDLQKQELLRQ